MMAGGLRHKDSLRWLVLPGFILCLLIVEAAAWLTTVRLPSGLEFQILGKTFEAHTLARKFMAIGFAAHLIVPATFALEWAFVGWDNCSVRRIFFRPSRSVLSDIAVYIAGMIGLFKVASKFLSLGIVLISADQIHQFIAEKTGLDLNASALPLWAQVLALTLVYTFFDYWSHRADHSPAFWPLHRYHHAADEFCILTSDRVHPAAFTDAIVACASILLGGSASAFAIMYAIISTQRHVIHSNIDSDFGWVGRYLIQSPRHHRLHHALDSADGVGNFSLCPIWDRLFGTWREAPKTNWPIGVSAPYRQGAWIGADMWRDYVEFWTGLVPSLTSLRPARADLGPRHSADTEAVSGSLLKWRN